MANPNAKTYDIDLASPNLNLDVNKFNVVPFEGFGYRNSPYISGEIKNLYTKEESIAGDEWIDEDNNIYKTEVGNISTGNLPYLSLNGKNIHTFGEKTLETAEDNYKHVGRVSLKKVKQQEIDIGLTFYDDNSEKNVVVANVNRKLIYDSVEFNHCKLYLCESNNGTTNPFILYTAADGSLHGYVFAMVDPNSKFESYDFYYKHATATDPNHYIIFSAFLSAHLINKWVFRIIRIPISYLTPVTIVASHSISFNKIRDVYVSYYCASDDAIVIAGTIDTTGNNPRPSSIMRAKYVINSNGIVSSYATAKVAKALYGDTPETIPDCFLTKSGHLMFNTPSDIYYDENTGMTVIDYTPILKWVDGDEIIVFVPKTRIYTLPEFIESYKIITTDEEIKYHFDGYSAVLTIRSGEVDGYIAYISAVAGVGLFEYYDITNESVDFNFRLEYTEEEDISEIPCLLYKGENINAVSFSHFKETRGTLITDFYSVDDVLTMNGFKFNGERTSTVVFTKDEYLYVASCRHTNFEPEFTVLNNRYLFFNNISDFFNAYDIKTETWFHYADDWNNRFGIILSNTQGGELWSDSWSSSQRGWISTAVNAFFEANEALAPSIQMNPVCTVFTSYSRGLFPLQSCGVPEPTYINSKYFGVDCFFNTDVTSSIPPYIYTLLYIYDTSLKKDVSYHDVYFPITEGNQILPLPLPIKFSYNEVVSFYQNTSTNSAATPILLIGTREYAAYYLLLSQENIDTLFSIQTGIFAIKDDWIFSLTMNNGMYTNLTKICSCMGLKYLCSTPLGAFFWSEFNKTLYQFQGDNLFHKGQTIDEITSVGQVKYIQSTNDVIMLTDKYTLVLSDQYAFKIKFIATDVFWTKDSIVLKNIENKKIYRFSYNALSGFDRQRIVVETLLYGLGNNMLSETDCLYIRVFNPNHEPGIWEVDVSGYILTDVSTTLNYQRFQIHNPDNHLNTRSDKLYWDEEWTCLIRYQPPYQKGIGVKFNIVSDMPIIYIGVSNSPDTKMITKR